jgi:hypothetical protein
VVGAGGGDVVVRFVVGVCTRNICAQRDVERLRNKYLGKNKVAPSAQCLVLVQAALAPVYNTAEI